MALQPDELSILVARCGAERCGASRCGFVPKDTKNEAGTAAGPWYHYAEQKQDADGTTYTVVRE